MDIVISKLCKVWNFEVLANVWTSSGKVCTHRRRKDFLIGGAITARIRETATQSKQTVIHSICTKIMAPPAPPIPTPMIICKLVSQECEVVYSGHILQSLS